MGRGRVELKRIENKINREVTSQREGMDCSRRLTSSQFCVMLRLLSSSFLAVESFMSSAAALGRMVKTLERYKKCSYGALEASDPVEETQSRYQEYLKLKEEVEDLQRSQRNLLGEDMGHLGTKELHQFEQQLVMSLKKIRTTKTQFMLDQLSELQRKEQMLLETNKALRSKLGEDSAENPLQTSILEDGAQNIPYSHQSRPSVGFFEPLECNGTLQIGYINPVAQDQMNVANSLQNFYGFIPGWMV